MKLIYLKNASEKKNQKNRTSSEIRKDPAKDTPIKSCGKRFLLLIPLLTICLTIPLFPIPKALADPADPGENVVTTGQTADPNEALPLPAKILGIGMISVLIGFPLSYELVRIITKPGKPKETEWKKNHFSSISLLNVKHQKIGEEENFVLSFTELDQPK